MRRAGPEPDGDGREATVTPVTPAKEEKKCNNLPSWTQVLVGGGHLESRTR